MLPRKDKIAFTVIGIVTILVIATILWKDDISAMMKGDNNSPVKLAAAGGNAGKKEKAGRQNGSPLIAQSWEMPDELKEISGIAYIDDDHLACVQDEEGTIFIYNLKSEQVEKKIPFGEKGDYEGIAIVGSTAYVLRADGLILEVSDYNGKPQVKEHQTPLTAKHDVEGLCYDQKNDRLLLAIKGKEPDAADYKGIYAFDLSTRKLDKTPAFKIDLTHEIWKEVKGKQKMAPSDLDIHPLTGDLYITDGAKPKLLVMDQEGQKKNLFELDESEFPQPEGVAFTPGGDLLISSEGTTGSGLIARVSMNGKK